VNALAAYTTIWVTTFWAYLTELTRREQSKRLYGLIGTGGVIGGLMANFTVWQYIESSGEAVLLTGAAGVTIVIGLIMLQALAAGPTHGYGVMRWIEEATGSAIQVDEGSLYPSLYRLEGRGWLVSEWGVSENNRRARFYRLTAKGRAQLKTEIGEFLRFARAMFQALDVPVGSLSG
jgi:transcriptional regulator